MIDPPRLRDTSGDPLLVEMLSQARHQEPNVGSVRRAVVSITAAAGVLGGHASAAATVGLATGTLTKLALKWTLMTTLIVGGGVAVVEVAPHLAGLTTRATNDRVSPTRAKAAPEPPRSRPPLPAVALPTAEAARAEVGSESSTLVRPKTLPPERSRQSEHLQAELALLDRSRLALANGDARRAASLARRYLESYPHGRLEQEARYLEMSALQVVGNREAARQQARELLELSPHGPHARRAREVVQATSAAPPGARAVETDSDSNPVVDQNAKPRP